MGAIVPQTVPETESEGKNPMKIVEMNGIEPSAS
jgi:hypothetical protein